MRKKTIGKIVALCSLSLIMMASAPVSISAATPADIGSKIEASVSMYKDVKVEMGGAGAVTLKGTVKNQAERDDAVKRAREIPGVKSVNDQLTVTDGESGSAGAYIDDAAVTAEVKARILAQKGLDSLDISVETVKGEVTLTGEVENQEQISMAESSAAKVEGVKKITNRLTVKK